MPDFQTPTRREFLAQAGRLAAAGAALAPVSFSQAADMEKIPIIDTHQHLWDLKKFRLPWLKDVPELKKDFLLADYHEAAQDLNVVKTVYMEVDVDPAQRAAEADYVVELCGKKDSKMAAAVISGRPAEEGFAAYLRKYKEPGHVKGVRQVLHTPVTPAGYCLQPAFMAGVRVLGELGMSYDVCVRPGELPDAVKLIDACPDTRFILDHCGNPNPLAKDLSPWRRDIAQVAKRERVMCKISGLADKAIRSTKEPPAEGRLAEDLSPVVRHALDVFGPDRVMFGGDWPVCTLGSSLRQWVLALQAIVAGRREKEQRALFHDNAAKFYGLG
ncbi:MAG: amidohydrolase family protein [Planctomycetia bacterium]|nr:amidohydrolase family protein [Planctomycetia bacterium]